MLLEVAIANYWETPFLKSPPNRLAAGAHRNATGLRVESARTRRNKKSPPRAPGPALRPPAFSQCKIHFRSFSFRSFTYLSTKDAVFLY